MAERKKLLLRLDPQVHDAIAKWAVDDIRSVNAQIEYLLRRALRAAGRGRGTAAGAGDDPGDESGRADGESGGESGQAGAVDGEGPAGAGESRGGGG